MQYYINEDGTYKGIKYVSGLDENGIEFKNVKVEYPRIKIDKWKDDIEFGIPLQFELLASLDIEPNLVNITEIEKSEALI